MKFEGSIEFSVIERSKDRVVSERFVERCGEADGLWKHRCASAARHAMQGLVPPVVRGNAQARNCRSLVDELRDLLVEGEPADQIGHALF